MLRIFLFIFVFLAGGVVARPDYFQFETSSQTASSEKSNPCPESPQPDEQPSHCSSHCMGRHAVEASMVIRSLPPAVYGRRHIAAFATPDKVYISPDTRPPNC